MGCASSRPSDYEGQNAHPQKFVSGSQQLNGHHANRGDVRYKPGKASKGRRGKHTNAALGGMMGGV